MGCPKTLVAVRTEVTSTRQRGISASASNALMFLRAVASVSAAPSMYSKIGDGRRLRASSRRSRMLWQSFRLPEVLSMDLFNLRTVALEHETASPGKAVYRRAPHLWPADEHRSRIRKIVFQLLARDAQFRNLRHANAQAGRKQELVVAPAKRAARYAGRSDLHARQQFAPGGVAAYFSGGSGGYP